MHSSCFVNRHVLRTKYIVACTESKGDAVEALAQKTVMCIVSSLISEDFHLCFLKLEVMVWGGSDQIKLINILAQRKEDVG